MPHDIKKFSSDHCIIKGLVGSQAYGTSLDTHDTDLLGICIEPKDYLLGITSPFNEYVYRSAEKGERSKPGDTDLTVYSARKWVRLACKGNPSILALMFSPLFHVYYEPYASMLFGQPEWFVTQSAANSFLGYMKGQRDSLLGLRGRRTNRPELIEQHGYDTKFAYHLIRLGYQGIEFLTTGTMTQPLPPAQRDVLMRIRHGKTAKESVVSYSIAQERRIEILKKSVQPEAPMDAVNRMLIELYETYWTKEYT